MTLLCGVSHKITANGKVPNRRKKGQTKTNRIVLNRRSRKINNYDTTIHFFLNTSCLHLPEVWIRILWREKDMLVELSFSVPQQKFIVTSVQTFVVSIDPHQQIINRCKMGQENAQKLWIFIYSRLFFLLLASITARKLIDTRLVFETAAPTSLPVIVVVAIVVMVIVDHHNHLQLSLTLCPHHVYLFSR
jgi:hypothetical protein